MGNRFVQDHILFVFCLALWFSKYYGDTYDFLASYLIMEFCMFSNKGFTTLCLTYHSGVRSIYQIALALDGTVGVNLKIKLKCTKGSVIPRPN